MKMPPQMYSTNFSFTYIKNSLHTRKLMECEEETVNYNTCQATFWKRIPNYKLKVNSQKYSSTE
jgi:hypothetical protein